MKGRSGSSAIHPGAEVRAGHAGFLLLACVAVCVWAGVQGRIADREVDRAIARMVAAREDDQRRRSPTRGTPDG